MTRRLAGPLIAEGANARRSPQRLRADSARVVAQLFIPGQERFDHQGSRSSTVLTRILALSDDEVQAALDDVMTRFSRRHRDLVATFGEHATQIAEHLHPAVVLTPSRRLLLGATFTSEYAIEGAALCNPSIVAHPDQSGVEPGALRFVMSVRCIGEGHRSSIGFRTGVVAPDGRAVVDAASPFAAPGRIGPAALHASVFRGEVERLRTGGENVDFVLDGLGDQFSLVDLELQLGRLQAQAATRKRSASTISAFRRIAERTYGVSFEADSPLSERVLMPAVGAESNGMEDARFVRFDADGGAVRYMATYTAYNGTEISQQLIETTDFCSFTSSPIVGAAAANKGLAIFPRRIGGRYAALSRSDRETNTVTFSQNLHRWEHALSCQVPMHPWELLQLGNCGSPIETEAGWLVLTHGVGPMRTYSVGVILLDLEDPTRILGRLRTPLLTPLPDEQDGYVPNVVYSCGGLVHAGTLVIPYGIGDASIGVATVPMAGLLDALEHITN